VFGGSTSKRTRRHLAKQNTAREHIYTRASISPRMISFNTFTGELHGAATCDNVDDDTSTEMNVGAKELGDDDGALAFSENSSEDASSDVSTDAQSVDSASDRYDLFHERCEAKKNRCENSAAQANKPPRRKSTHSKRGKPAGGELSQFEAGRPPPIIVKPVEDEAQGPQQQGGRVLQLFHLLTFKNQAGDAKSALIQKLIAVTNVKELVMSKATQDQIASAANDAITDEILATVDLEDKRRQSISSQLVSNDMNTGTCSTKSRIYLLRCARLIAR
jgi:hypothetical protein